MRIAVLSNPDSWYRRDLERAATARGHSVTGLPFSQLAAQVGCGGGEGQASQATPLNAFDAVVVRTMPPGSLEQVIFRMNALARLERSGVQVLNSARSIECAVDKYLTTALLREAGLPVPPTRVCETAEQALEALADLGGDVVVKPLFGSEGRGILRVNDPDLGLRVFRTLERLNCVLYLQRFIPHAGFDVRVLVLDGAVVAAMKRSNPDDFRTNVSRSGVGSRLDPSPEQREWAVRAAAAVGTRLAGVDLLYGPGGEGYVIEVNGVPGWQALQRVTQVDVAALVIQSLEQGPSPAAAVPPPGQRPDRS
ncbi:MAG: RimK family alpha-L-glutamate ligase [Planctomycetaceae bacterium]